MVHGLSEMGGPSGKEWRMVVGGVILATAAVTSATPLTAFVDPFIGTGGGGGLGGWGNAQLNPGAMMPFPLMRLGPDTSLWLNGTALPIRWDHYAGYCYIDTHIDAMSTTHLQGGGMDDLGNFGFMVTRSPFDVVGASASAPYRSAFHHVNETASPGYYAAYLADAATLAEAAVSGSSTGMLRFTCAGADGPSPCLLVVDVCHVTHTGGCPYGDVTVTAGSDPTGAPSVLVTGSTLDAGDFAQLSPIQGVKFYFAASITAVDVDSGAPVSPTTVQAWAGDGLLPSGPPLHANTTSGNIGAIITFPPPATTASTRIAVRIGISMRSVNQAQANLYHDQLLPGGSPQWLAFDAMVTNADAAWEAVLARTQVPSLSDVPPLPHHSLRNGPRLRASTAAAVRQLATPDGCTPHLSAFADLPARAQARVRQWLRSDEGTAWRRREAARLAHSALDGTAPAQVASARLLEDSMDAAVCYMAVVSGGRGEGGGDDGAGHVQGEARAHRTPWERSAWGDASVDATVLYTAIYHSYCAPSQYSETDGLYIGFDGATHTVWNTTSGPSMPSAPGPSGRFLSDLSLWDIHRTQSVWMYWTVPDVWADMVKSLVVMTQQSGNGSLPRWPFASFDTLIMQGSHGLEVIIDGVLKGGTNWGSPAATLSALGISIPAADYVTLSAIAHQDDSMSYGALGYVPVEAFQRGASQTLEYAFDDGVAAAFAARMGDTAHAALWGARGNNYANVWSTANASACPRYANGTIICPSDLSVPHPFNPWYTEGDSVQWQWFVPHNLTGLVALFPSPQHYVDALNTLQVNQQAWIIGTVLPNPWYWAGNEPDILAPWQFMAAGGQYANYTQYWTRWLLTEYYTTRFDGIPGNDDYGTLSAWAVFAYIGLYPIAGTDQYVLGSPVFPNITVQLPTVPWLPATSPLHPVLNVIATNASADNVYVSSVQVNGMPVTSGVVSHATLFAPAATGGIARVEFSMSPNPPATSTDLAGGGAP